MATATTTARDGRHAYRPQAIGRVFGWFFLATILTSVPAYFVGYHRMLNNQGPGSEPGQDTGPSPPRCGRGHQANSSGQPGKGVLTGADSNGDSNSSNQCQAPTTCDSA